MELCCQGDGRSAICVIEQGVVEGGQGEAEEFIVRIAQWGFGFMRVLRRRIEGTDDVGEGVFVCASEAFERKRRGLLLLLV